MADKNGSKMGFGLLVGMVLGAIGGLFLAPKSGKENRDALAQKMNEMKDMMDSGEIKKKVQDALGDWSEESMRLYTQTRENILKGIEDMKSMSSDDYAKLVQKAMDTVKDKTQMSSDKLNKLKDHFMKEGKEMKEEAHKEGKKIAKKKSE